MVPSAPLQKGDTVKNLDVKSKMSLIRMKRLIMDYLEVCNSISENDFRVVVLASQKKKKYLKNIHDNVERGNLFMMLFFIRELIEAILNSEE